MNLPAVKVPRELLAVPAVVLEEYVRNRLLQFIRGFGQRMAQLSPQLDPAILDRAVRDTLEGLPLPDYGQVPVEMLELQLVFRHDCLALGCTEPQCVLCQHNSQRRCAVNFNKKYLVNDRMVARCGAAIRIELVDRASGKLFDGELPDVYLEMFVLDGAAHDQKFLGEARAGGAGGSGRGAWADAALDECALLTNNKGQALISSLTAGRTDEAMRLILTTVGGRLVLPDLFITDSSEALLSGRKPPFRLVVRARHTDGRHLAIRHAVSEPFVVATRRVRASHKVEIPSMDDPVSKLDHMGKETVRKLADLRSAAAQVGTDLSALEPELTRIEKVGEFKALALRAEGDGHLRQQLQALLKLAKEKWDEAAEHAKRAVVPDNRLRAWYADRNTLELGLLFPCRLGVVDLKRPQALLQRVTDASGASKIEVVPQQQQAPAQRDAVRQLLPQAEASWWAPGHLGWTIFPADTESFEANAATSSGHLFDLALFGGGHAAAPLHNSTPAAAGSGGSAPGYELPGGHNSAPDLNVSMNGNGHLHTLHMAPRDASGGLLHSPQLMPQSDADATPSYPPPGVLPPSDAVPQNSVQLMMQQHPSMTADAALLLQGLPLPADVQPMVSVEPQGMALPLPEDLQALLDSGNLPEEMRAAALAAMYDSTQAQQLLAAMYNSSQQQRPTPEEQPRGDMLAPAAPGAMAGFKRTYSAAAGSHGGGSGSTPAYQPALSQASLAAAQRPMSSSFSGAIDTTRRAAAAALAEVDGSNGGTILEEAPGDAAAAAAAATVTGGDDDLALQGPFYAQLRRDSMKSRSRGARGSSSRNALDAAAAAAIAAVDAAAPGAEASAGGSGAPGAAGAAATASGGTGSGPLGTGSLDIRDLPHGQSLDIDGLRAVYPSVLLDDLAAGADSGSGPLPPAPPPPPESGHSGGPAVSSAAAAANQLSPDMERMAGGTALGSGGASAMQMSLNGSLLDFSFSRPYALGKQGMSYELLGSLLHGVSSAGDGVAGTGSGGVPSWGSGGARKPLQLADSGLANMVSINVALEEAVSGEVQHMQQD